MRSIRLVVVLLAGLLGTSGLAAPDAALGRMPDGAPGARGAVAAAPSPQAGPGWRLTTIQTGVEHREFLEVKRNTLVLLDPAGRRYPLLSRRVTPGSNGLIEVADWSADGRTALLRSYRHDLPIAVSFDLGTGHQTVLDLPTRTGYIHLLPDGSGVLVEVQAGLNGGGPRLLRITWDGHRTVVLDDVATVLLSPDHQTMVVARIGIEEDTWLVVSTTTGVVVQTVETDRTCFPVRWWDASTVLATCYVQHFHLALRLVPLDGRPDTELSTYHGARALDTADLDGRRVRGRLYLQASGACNYYYLARQRSNGSAQRVRVPGAFGNVLLIGAAGRRLVLSLTTTCGSRVGRAALVRFDPFAGTVRVLTRLRRGQHFGPFATYGEPRGRR